jgi:hypothetical protein
MSTFFIILSSLLALTSASIYVRAIINGQAKPHRTTRIVILLFTILATASLVAKHDTVAVWLAAVSTLQAITIFTISLKYGIGGWAKIDICCLFIAIIGIFFWKTTQNPNYALFSAITADFVGMIPTLIKAHRFPDTEIWLFWLIDTFTGLFSLFAVRSWNFSQFVYPLYIALVNFSVFLLIIKRGKLSRPTIQL